MAKLLLTILLPVLAFASNATNASTGNATTPAADPEPAGNATVTEAPVTVSNATVEETTAAPAEETTAAPAAGEETTAAAADTTMKKAVTAAGAIDLVPSVALGVSLIFVAA